MNDDLLTASVRAVRARQWSGPDHCPKVEAMLKKERTVFRFPDRRKTSIAVILAATLTGGAVAATVTHQVLSRRATLTLDDGSQFEVELLGTPTGASGSFVADDGTEYFVRTIETDSDQSVSVNVSGDQAASVSVDVDDGPSMGFGRRPAPGARARASGFGASVASDEGDG